jgi:hypothetical protein
VIAEVPKTSLNAAQTGNPNSKPKRVDEPPSLLSKSKSILLIK